MSDRDLAKAHEFIKDRLYYVALRSTPHNSDRCHFFTIDHELVYWNFFLDFGPLNLGQLYRFCERLREKLNDRKLATKRIYFYSGTHPHHRANAAVLICCFAVLYLGCTPEEAYRPFASVYPPFPPFHDASPCVCTFTLTVLDCVKGLYRARQCGFFNFDTFDCAEYEHYEQLDNGDLNWIVAGRFLAFAGPHNSKEESTEGYSTLTPEHYISYFQRTNVRLVVRLNKKYYDETRFTRHGIKHMELYYLDGSTPSDEILQRFLSACEAEPGGIAVHCKAGLGRTGTTIGCYLMKHYRITAHEAIAWIRICRPGSIIGPQQHYMKQVEHRMWQEGELYRARLTAEAALSTRAAAAAAATAAAAAAAAGAELVGPTTQFRRSPSIAGAAGATAMAGHAATSAAAAAAAAAEDDDLQDALAGLSLSPSSARTSRTASPSLRIAVAGVAASPATPPPSSPPSTRSSSLRTAGAAAASLGFSASSAAAAAVSPSAHKGATTQLPATYASPSASPLSPASRKRVTVPTRALAGLSRAGERTPVTDATGSLDGGHGGQGDSLLRARRSPKSPATPASVASPFGARSATSTRSSARFAF